MRTITASILISILLLQASCKGKEILTPGGPITPNDGTISVWKTSHDGSFCLYKLPTNLTFSLACLIQFYKGIWKNEALPVKDTSEIVEAFNTAWQLENLDLVVTNILSNIEFWGEDLTKINGLTEAVVLALKEINSNGIENGYANFSK